MYTLRHCVENIKLIYDASHRANKWVACASRMQISIDMSRGERLKLDLSKIGKSINRRKNLGTAGYRPGTAGEVLLAENYSKNHRSHGRKLRVP